MNLLHKLSQLRNFFAGSGGDPQDVVVIDSWIDEANKLFLLKSLKEHDGVRYVLKIFKTEVDAINTALLGKYSRELPDTERDRLLDKRDLAQKYLNLFTPIDQRLEELESEVDNELNK